MTCKVLQKTTFYCLKGKEIREKQRGEEEGSLQIKAMGASQSKRGEYRTHKSNRNSEGDSRSFEHGTYQASESHRNLIEPKKLPNPVRESRHHRELHRELLFTQRRGLLPEHKPELQRVLEARRMKQLKQQEENQKPLSDLEEELRKRQQKLDQYERDMVLKGEQDGRPEFILVKESLKKIKLSKETDIRQT
ncbi:protein FAM107B-like isoform X1 [Anolis sagrei]|uniref:protein FAM107B-like isoform X1 n=1 Tax=Anolis sagrei TaxID=38937 RepID=UPI00351FA32A